MAKREVTRSHRQLFQDLTIRELRQGSFFIGIPEVLTSLVGRQCAVDNNLRSENYDLSSTVSVETAFWYRVLGLLGVRALPAHRLVARSERIGDSILPLLVGNVERLTDMLEGAVDLPDVV